MEHKNQHWIPRSYLKAWCDPAHKDNVVHKYGVDGIYMGWRPPSRIFSSDDLYTVTVEGARDLRTEKALKTIEDHYLKVRRALETGGPFPSDTKTIMACFVASMRNRSPAARDHWQDFKDRGVALGDEMEAAIKRASPEERRRLAKMSLPGSRDKSRSMTLDQARVSAAEPFGKWVLRHIRIEAGHLEKMSLILLKAPPGIGFITSDNPVAWYDARFPLDQQGHPFGLGNRHIEITMPVSPSLCALFDHSGNDATGDVSQGMVDIINSRTLAACDTTFIANSPDLVVDWFKPDRRDSGASRAAWPGEI